MGVCLSACSKTAPPTPSTDTGSATEPWRPSEEPIWIEVAFEDGQHLTETLAACSAAWAAQAHQLVCVQDGVALWIDEGADAPLELGAAAEVSAVVVDDTPWIRLDDTLFALRDGGLVPLDLGLPVSIETMVQAGGSPWLSGAGRLYEVRGAGIHEVAIEGVSAIHAHAATPSHVFVATPELVILSRDADGLSVEQVWPHPVTSLSVDDAGLLWLVSEGVPYVWTGDGEPIPVRVSEPVHAVHGPALWMVADSGLYRLQGRGFSHHPMDASGVLGVDPLGRVLQLRDDTLMRHAIGRPVAMPDLPEVLEVQQEVRLLPTDASTVMDLSVWVDDQPVVVRTDPWRATFDPDGLPEGERELRVFTESELGDHVYARSLWIGALPEVEWPAVQAISEANCQICHGGETATRLETSDDWRIHIDRILEVVNSGEMPLGGERLSEEDIVTIRAWQHGGFQ